MKTEKEIFEWYKERSKEIAESDAPDNPIVAGNKMDEMKVLNAELAVKLAVRRLVDKVEGWWK